MKTVHLPHQCAYTYSQRLDIAFVLATLISVFGSLNAALKLLLSLMIIFVQYTRHNPMRGNEPKPSVPSIDFISGLRTRFLRAHIVRITRTVRCLNYFKTKWPLNEPQPQQQASEHELIATRAYILLFIASISIVLIYSSLEEVVGSVTVQSPSLYTFERLQNEYSATLKCPCSQTCIRHDQFLNVTPVYHQVSITI